MAAFFAPFGPPAGGGADEAVLLAMLLIFGVGMIIGLVIQILFLLTLSRALGRCQPANRSMEPGMVWLNLVPFFGVIWIFITVQRLADSLRNEFQDRGLARGEQSYGRGVGMTYAVCMVINALISGVNVAMTLSGNPNPFIGCVAAPFGLAGFICWILYWVQIAGHSTRLADTAPEFDDDHRHRPRTQWGNDDDREDSDFGRGREWS